MFGTPKKNTEPTPAEPVNPALPDGYDDPNSRFHVVPDLRRYYRIDGREERKIQGKPNTLAIGDGRGWTGLGEGLGDAEVRHAVWLWDQTAEGHQLSAISIDPGKYFAAAGEELYAKRYEFIRHALATFTEEDHDWWMHRTVRIPRASREHASVVRYAEAKVKSIEQRTCMCCGEVCDTTRGHGMTDGVLTLRSPKTPLGWRLCAGCVVAVNNELTNDRAEAARAFLIARPFLQQSGV